MFPSPTKGIYLRTGNRILTREKTVREEKTEREESGELVGKKDF